MRQRYQEKSQIKNNGTADRQAEKKRENKESVEIFSVNTFIE